MTQTTIPRLNDVYEYSIDDGQSHMCREGVALALLDYDNTVILQDTYWSFRRDYDSHVLTATEAATATLIGNLDDYRDVSKSEQSSYAEADRLTVTGQHSLSGLFYVRKGAEKDRETILANARYAVEVAQEKVHSAQRALDQATADLAHLEATA